MQHQPENHPPESPTKNEPRDRVFLVLRPDGTLLVSCAGHDIEFKLSAGEVLELGTAALRTARAIAPWGQGPAASINELSLQYATVLIRNVQENCGMLPTIHESPATVQ
jgi:hypothetical protein